MWLGFCTPHATSGLLLRDNGVCVIDEHNVLFAISEERISQSKHDYRIEGSLQAWKEHSGHGLEGIRSLGVSSCSDLPWSQKEFGSNCIEIKKHTVPSHHFSHALSGFLLSPFETALVLVMDAGGNVLAGNESKEWWSLPHEQTSLWLGREKSVYLLERLHFAPFDIGWGEWFRAFTYFLGWPSHSLAGNTMALSAFGSSDIIKEDLFQALIKYDVRVQNDPKNPIRMVSKFLSSVGREDIQPRGNGESITENHKNLAAYLQRSLCNWGLNFIDASMKKYRIDSVCLTGGVAQNCILNAQIAAHIGVDKTYISPFAGDVGQCLGNAMYARSLDLPNAPRVEIKDTFLGPRYKDESILNAILESGFKFDFDEPSVLAAKFASALTFGKIGALFQGRSEFGPRALGNRSVVADPKQQLVVQRVKTAVKCRDDFMPLAPAIHPQLAEELSEYIPISSTMVYAPVIPAKYREDFGYSLHFDNTARIQVPTDPHSMLNLVLDSFLSLTGRRVLLNTSFNQRGKPIVETPHDALEAFVKLDIDIIIIGSYIVKKP